MMKSNETEEYKENDEHPTNSPWIGLLAIGGCILVGLAVSAFLGPIIGIIVTVILFGWLICKVEKIIFFKGIKDRGDNLKAEELKKFSIAEQELSTPLLDGYEIMEKLNLKPGPKIGELLIILRKEQQVGRIKEKKEAVKFLKRYLKSNTIKRPIEGEYEDKNKEF